MTAGCLSLGTHHHLGADGPGDDSYKEREREKKKALRKIFEKQEETGKGKKKVKHQISVRQMCPANAFAAAVAAADDDEWHRGAEKRLLD